MSIKLGRAWLMIVKTMKLIMSIVEIEVYGMINVIIMIQINVTILTQMDIIS